MTRLTLILLSVLVLAAPAFAGDGDGGYAAPWLQVPVGARPTALGGAYLAISDDGAAPLFNPAGVGGLSRPMVSSSYRVMALDRTLAYITAMSPIRGDATLGAHWLHSGSGSVEARDGDGYLTGHEISMTSNQFTVIFAKKIARYLSAGVNLSYLLADMPELDASAVGFDFGMMLFVDQLVNREKRDRMPVRDIKIGLVARNFSKTFRWVSDDYNRRYTTGGVGSAQDDDVPLEFGLGASARFMQRQLLVTMDGIKNEKQSISFRSGAEYFVTPEFMLRAGYGDSRFTAGTGYLFKIGNNGLAVDYAFTTDRVDEGSEHIFSFDFLF
jgi:hypothetical protein